MGKKLILQPVLFVIILLFIPQHSPSVIEFHRETSGVVFGAYVKTIEDGEQEDWKGYYKDEVKTMLNVISSKFTRVTTYGAGADNVPYKENATYHESNAQGWAAEMAALINQEKGERVLSMITGIWLSDLNKHQQTNTEINLALESARLANSIFEGTIEGFVFSQHDIHNSSTRANQTLFRLRGMRNATQLKIGTRQPCSGISGDDDAIGDLAMIRREIIEASDFIICKVVPAAYRIVSGAGNGFLGTVQYDLLEFRREFQEINPNIEVMGQTGLAYRGDNSWETLENMERYWKVVDKWGSEKNFTMWMFESFDNPWKGVHTGWWRLKKNALANQTDGYAENIVDPPKVAISTAGMIDSAAGVWVYIGLALALVVIAVVLSAVGVLYFRVQKLQDALTTEDVKEFMYGLTDEAAAEQGGYAMCPSALTFPYDKSYEIAKENMTINRTILLGSGQFGCVFKAVIVTDEGKVDVALKMTKSNCPKTALLSLLSEIKILTYLGKHPNIVAMRGAYTVEIKKGIVYVATELCPNGSLEDYLRKKSFVGSDADDVQYVNESKTNPGNYAPEKSTVSDVTLMDMVRWSHEIACGMEYLGEKQVVHADLATRNVLLDGNKTAKITDFGLSRRLYDYTNYVKQQQEPLPWRWMAIETLKRLEFSEKSDVWSYGVTLWEIFAMGDLPYPGLNWSLEFVDTLVNGLRMNSPTHATTELYEIMASCWQTDPDARPSFNDLKVATGQALDLIASPDSHFKYQNKKLWKVNQPL